MSGTLYLCATPIGNLGDISERAVQTLKNADLIAAEDTRNSLKLLTHLGIHTPLTSYHEHNRFDKAKTLLQKLQSGESVALITDAGMPGISDPGEELVRLCAQNHVPVTALPGASACVTALALSGLSTRRFVFEGFLPRQKKERRAVLADIQNETRTLIFYEAPHRLAETLRVLSAVLGEERRLALCRELTKKHEEIRRTTLGSAAEEAAANGARGEYVLVIAGKAQADLAQEHQKQWQAVSPAAHVAFYEEQGHDRKEAMKLAAKDRGVSRRDLYAALLANTDTKQLKQSENEEPGGVHDHIS